MTFALILLLLTLVTGVLFLWDVIFWHKKKGQHRFIDYIVEQGRSFFPIFLLVFLLRSFLIEPFRIPSGSLVPTLNVGDFIAVKKYSYGLRFPVLEKKLVPLGKPKAGDIAVFRWPPYPEKYDYIKRVIGLPGDHIEYKNKQLIINGTPAAQTFVRYTTDESSGHAVAEYQENLEGVTHRIYVRPDATAVDFDVHVPAGNYFMMGDNRDDSADSRFFGFVQDSYLRGQAWLVWFSWDSQKDRVRFDRIGMIH